MYIKDYPNNPRIYFTQESMSKSSRMIVLQTDNATYEFGFSIEEARNLANELLKSINEFENKFNKR